MKDFMENNFKTDDFIEILKIIKENNVKYSQNSNGSFINLSAVTQDTLIKIKNFIDFYKINQDNLKITEDKLDQEKEKQRQHGKAEFAIHIAHGQFHHPAHGQGRAGQ